jgi:hypothetical protein
VNPRCDLFVCQLTLHSQQPAAAVQALLNVYIAVDFVVHPRLMGVYQALKTVQAAS